MDRLRLALLLAAAAVLALAVPAHAAKVSAPQIVYPEGYVEATAMFVGEPGEANDVTVTVSDSPFAVLYEDTAAPITAGENCESLDEHSARCFGPIAQLNTRLADGDDTYHLGSFAETVGPIYATTSGGDGDDHLFGGVGNDSLDGDAGDDTIAGGGGRDQIDGGAHGDDLSGGDDDDRIDGGTGVDDLNGDGGDDRLDGEGENTVPASADTIDGGAGEDLVSYYLHRGSIDVDLARGTGNGAAGENDALMGIENAEGSYGGGRIAGDAGPNELYAGIGGGPVILNGRGGDDRLVGGFDDDVLSGGHGDDLLEGWGGSNEFHAGAGADELQTQSPSGGTVDRAVSCGPDEDRVTKSDEGDVIPRSCEYVRIDRGFRASPALRRANGPAIAIEVERPRRPPRCRVVVGLYGPAPATAPALPRRMAFGNFKVGRDTGLPKTVRLNLRLNAYGRRLLKEHRHLRIRVRIEPVLECGAAWPASRTPRYAFTARL